MRVLPFIMFFFGIILWSGEGLGQGTQKTDDAQLRKLRIQAIASMEETVSWCDHKEKIKTLITQLKAVPEKQFPIEYVKLLKSILEEKTYKEIKCLGEGDAEVRFDIYVIGNSQENIEKYLIPFFANREVSRSFSKLPLEYMRSSIVAALGRSFPKNDSERKKYLMIALKELKRSREENIGFFIADGEDKLLKSIGEELNIKIQDYVKVAEKPNAAIDCGPGTIHDVYVPKEFAVKFKNDETCKIALDLFRLLNGESGHNVFNENEPYFWRNKKKIADLVSTGAFSRNFKKTISPKDKKDYIDFMKGPKKDFYGSLHSFSYKVWESCRSKYDTIVDTHDSSCD